MATLYPYSRASKYKNQKSSYNGRNYDSKKERDYAQILDLRLKAGEITNIEYQPKFLLQPAFKDKNNITHRKIEYWADFQITYPNGDIEVIDTKGFKTEIYKLKKKLFLFHYPHITFIES